MDGIDNILETEPISIQDKSFRGFKRGFFYSQLQSWARVIFSASLHSLRANLQCRQTTGKSISPVIERDEVELD